MYLRTFSEHMLREVESLCGRWEFVAAADRKDRGRLPSKYTRTISVPSCWELIPDLINYRGKGWFRTRFNAIEGMATRLVFGGVSHTGTVFVDGKKIGSHYDAFTPWEVVAPNLDEGEHELVVEVDNTFGPHSTLHIDNDYYTYGGITRPVELQFLPEVYIDKLFATPRWNRGKWNVEVKVTLRNWTKQSLKRRVAVNVGGKEEVLGNVTVKPRSIREVKGVVSNVEGDAWTPETPNLTWVQAELFDGEWVEDDKIDRIGLRSVQVRGKKLMVNGQSIRLRGYNRHEDHGQFGCAIPLEAMVADLEIFRDLGCNFVRTCHYPNDQRFLDLCDEMGFYVWEESHARQTPFDPPNFKEQISQSTEEMMQWHHNHASIIMWGALNECESHTKRGRKIYEHVIKIIRKYDDSRPVTAASHMRKKDICHDLVDIVSWNLYGGWYGHQPGEIGADIKDMMKWLHGSTKSGGKGKPVILSEFGAGAIPGWRHPNRAKWTEEYQADLLDTALDIYLNHPDIIGAAIWQYCDCRVCEGHFNGRPRTMNNKGTVDEYRRPKLAYETVKKQMHAAVKKFDK